MPFTKANAPKAVKALPEGAQKIWLAAYNNAIKEYKGDEAKAFGTAWAAVKTKYEQDDKGNWKLKKGKGRGMEEEEQSSLPMLTRAVAAFQSNTLDEEARTIEVTWTTGATVRRAGFFSGAFDEELLMGDENVDLSRLNSGAPVLNSHNAYDLSKILGVVEDGSARLLGPKGQRRGRATVRFSERADVEPIWQDVKAGIIRNISAGYSVQKWQRINPPPTAEGEDAIPLMRAIKWTPMELSLVGIPADAGAQTRAGEVYPCTIRTTDEEETTVTRAASGAAAEAADPNDPRPGEVQPPVPATQPGQNPPADPQPTQPPPPAPPGQPAEERAALDGATRERARITAIQDAARNLRLTGPADLEYVSGLVSRGVDAEQAMRDLIAYAGARWDARADASPAATITGGHSGSTQHRAAAAGDNGGVRGGQDDVETMHRGIGDALFYQAVSGHRQLFRDTPEVRDFRPDDNARQYMNMGFMDIGREVLRAAGINCRGWSKPQIAAQMLTPGYGVRNASYGRLVIMHRNDDGGLHSLSDFVTLLANTVNRELRAAYEAAPQTFTGWAQRITLADFRPALQGVLSGITDLQPVLEDGEFKRGTLSDSGETISLATFGEVLGVTRQVLVNDDVGMITRIPLAYGQAARNTESNVVYAVLLGNPVMADGTVLFHANHGNLSSTSDAITIASVGAARVGMVKQTDPSGRTNLAIMPRWLLVPPSKALSAEQLFAPFVAQQPSNALPESLRSIVPVMEPRLENGVAVGQTTYAGSATAWYVIADPSPNMPTVAYAYLQGQEGLYTEQRVGFDVDGIEFKARLDFAAKAAETRSMFKNPGS